MVKFQNTFVPEGKNISIICFKQTIYLNGIYFYAQDLIEELSKTNNVSLYANTVFFNSLKPDVKNRINSVHAIPSFSNKVYKWIWSLVVFPFKMLRKNDDLVIFTAEDIPALPFGILGKLKVFPFKTSMVVHDLAEYFVGRYSFWKDIYRRFIVKRLIWAVDYIITVSQKTRDDILTLNFKRNSEISIFYNQVKRKEVIQDTKCGDFIIYVSGLDYPSKNHLWLIDEYAKIVGNGFKSKLYLVGNAHPNSLHLSRIEKRIHELHLEEMVVVKQNVSNEELEELYRSCLFSVFPSKYEGFGRPIIESINYGKEVYSTDVGIYQEVKDNSLVHPFHEIHKRVSNE